MNKLSKRGMMDDLFDFLFTVLVSFFVFFFINGLLDQGIKVSHAQTRTELSQFHAQESALAHLFIQAQQGGEVTAEQLPEKIEKSSIVGGKQITVCEDYETKVDCENDVLNAGIDGKCRWKKTKCFFQPRRGAGQLQ
ncbi:MAG: hypothetical protein AABX13_05465 [Nanoarchaeota archaeon]